jgi:hypothetical protein
MIWTLPTSTRLLAAGAANAGVPDIGRAMTLMAIATSTRVCCQFALTTKRAVRAKEVEDEERR